MRAGSVSSLAIDPASKRVGHERWHLGACSLSCEPVVRTDLAPLRVWSC